MVTRLSMVLIFSLILCLSSFSQNYPFPKNFKFTGCIMPNHITTAKMNRDITNLYTNWKDSYIHISGNTIGGYYVFTNGDTDGRTVSEAHGYGMLITALMAGWDSDAKKVFDGLYYFFKDHPSVELNGLMSWLVDGTSHNESKDSPDNSATDGDMDIAYALLLAHYQWGSTGSIDYLSEAQILIQAIKSNEMGQVSKRIMLGDWSNPYSDNDYGQYATRSSDWMLGHLRSFHSVTNDNFWLTVADTIFNLIDRVSNPATGLVPDFIIGENAQPAYANFLEDANDGSYYANACRYPWRIATDYAHNATAKAKSVLVTLLDFIVADSDGDPTKIANGYFLSGINIGSKKDAWPMYMSPMVAASVVDSKYQQFLNKGWSAMCLVDDNYYGETLTLLSMLFISGNWWEPSVQQNTTATTSSKNTIVPFNIIANSNGTVTIDYTLTKLSSISAILYSLQGRKIATLVSSSQNDAGFYTATITLPSTLSHQIGILKLSIGSDIYTSKLHFRCK